MKTIENNLDSGMDIREYNIGRIIEEVRQQGKEIKIVLCAYHRGITGNEKADKAAMRHINCSI